MSNRKLALSDDARSFIKEGITIYAQIATGADLIPIIMWNFEGSASGDDGKKFDLDPGYVLTFGRREMFEDCILEVDDIVGKFALRPYKQSSKTYRIDYKDGTIQVKDD